MDSRERVLASINHQKPPRFQLLRAGRATLRLREGRRQPHLHRPGRSNSGSAILTLSRGDRSRITAETVAIAARQGDRLAREICVRMGVVLGVGISNMINTFNPRCIILGGRVSKASELFLPSCVETVRKRAWYASTKDVKVSRLERGEVMGAVEPGGDRAEARS